MNHFDRFRHDAGLKLFFAIAAQNVIALALVFCLVQFAGFSILPSVIVGIVASLGFGFAVSQLLTAYITAPTLAIWQAVLHLSPTEQGTTAPDIAKIKLGHDMVDSLTSQIYQIIDVAQKAEIHVQEESRNLSHNFVAASLPLPLLTLDANDTVLFANEAAAQYIGIAAQSIIGKNIYMVLDMSFPSDDTFDKWLKDTKLKSATASRTWERVRLNVRDDHPALLFDLASYYNRDNPQHFETMLILFDHTKAYSQDDQAVSFIALSVHELRTPLTLLRGYIEVFEDELAATNNVELQDFMLKMRSQAEQLTAFVNNILNVARVEGDQLQLQLQEENWTAVLKTAVNNLALRAKVRGITLRCRFATDLPTVGVDNISIQEVVNNLVDNAIKYSGASKTIEIDTHLTQDGMVETTIRDYGLGISTATIPNLFTKFYRDHRNRAQIGGTGLGLYLSKAIVTAHGGTVWVRSKENEGSTFGFTLVPYARLAEEIKQNGNQDITRGAHGWIKNHSLYRR